MSEPRAVAIGIVVDQRHVLVTSAVDPASGAVFVRPPGGGIETDESSSEAVVREFDEEFGVVVHPVRRLAERDIAYRFADVVRQERLVIELVEAAPDAFNGVSATKDKGHRTWFATAESLTVPDLQLLPADLLKILQNELNWPVSEV